MKTLSRNLFRLGIVVVALIALLIVVNNHQTVALSFFPGFTALTLPLYTVMFGFFLCGLIAGILSCSLHYTKKQFRYSRSIKQQKKLHESMQQEIASLKTDAYAYQQMQHRIQKDTP